MDLIGSYSNSTRLLEYLGNVQNRAGAGITSERRVRRRQNQVRLSSAQVDVLLEHYDQGEGINRLAARFGIHRTTVMEHLDRAGVGRRVGLIDRHLQEARQLYESGLSLAKVAQHFSVDGETVRQAFKRAGVPLRPRRGWS